MPPRHAARHNRSIDLADNLIHDGRRRLSGMQMRHDGSHWRVRQNEARAPQRFRPAAAERLASKPRNAIIDPPRLLRDARFERLRPLAMDEIIPVIEHEEPGIVEMRANPGRPMERRRKTVAPIDRRHESFLKALCGGKPQPPEEYVAGRKAMVKGAGRRPEARRHRADSHGGRSGCRRERTSGVEEIRVGKQGSSHFILEYVL
jgi:hypothetical protein